MKICGYEIPAPTTPDYSYQVHEYASHVRIDFVRTVFLFNSVSIFQMLARTRRISRDLITEETINQAVKELRDYSPYNAIRDTWVPRREGMVAFAAGGSQDII